jgi:hypothetical protein
MLNLNSATPDFVEGRDIYNVYKQPNCFFWGFTSVMVYRCRFTQGLTILGVETIYDPMAL